MLRDVIVKVQTSHRGDENVLLYHGAKKSGLREQPMPDLAREMGPMTKRYYLGSMDEKGLWTLDLGRRIIAPPAW